MKGTGEFMQETWFLFGDIHGDVYPIRRFYERNKEKLLPEAEQNHIILLGDVGANFALHGQRDIVFKMKMSEYPFTYICLRGNHEERVKKVMEMHPEDWEEREKYGGKIYAEKDYPQLEYLSDIPAVYNFDGYKTLSLPGAYSVDKWYRLLHGWPWFEEEQLSKKERDYGMQLKAENQPFDLVISHTCPLQYEPTDLFIEGVDQSMVDKTMEQYLKKIEQDLDYKRWAFGHYHADRLYPRNNGKQMLMLFNEKMVDLEKFMKMQEVDGLESIVVG